jgi:hypothetical protein
LTSSSRAGSARRRHTSTGRRCIARAADGDTQCRTRCGEADPGSRTLEKSHVILLEPHAQNLPRRHCSRPPALICRGNQNRLHAAANRLLHSHVSVDARDEFELQSNSMRADEPTDTSSAVLVQLTSSTDERVTRAATKLAEKTKLSVVVSESLPLIAACSCGLGSGDAAPKES